MKEGKVGWIGLLNDTCLSQMNGEDENHKKGDHREEEEAKGRGNSGQTRRYCRYSQPGITILMTGWEGRKVRFDSSLGFYILCN